MTNTENKTWTDVEAAQNGKATREFIAKADGAEKKALDYQTSAAVLLVAAKECLPHGTYLDWLSDHDINRRTASRLVQELNDPKFREKRLAAQRKASQEQRDRAGSKEERKASADKKEAALTPAQIAKRELLSVIAKLDEDGVMAAQIWIDHYVATHADDVEDDIEDDTDDDLEEAA